MMTYVDGVAISSRVRSIIAVVVTDICIKAAGFSQVIFTGLEVD
jgi:hypothetical protein